MESQSQRLRPLLPQGPVVQQSQDRQQPLSSGPRLTSRYRSRRKTNQDWEQIKEPFKRLYVDDNLPLQDVIRVLEARHGFVAT